MVRLKTRYLVVEATGARKLTVRREDITALIRESITKSYGDFGSGLSQYAFQVLYYNPQTRLAAIRCAREMCKMVETSLVFVTDLHNQDVSVRVARVCGTTSAVATTKHPVACCLCRSYLCLILLSVSLFGSGSSRTCREHLLKFSLERAKTLNLYAAQPNFDEDAQAEIALIDPQ
ncbi:hypothetical protein V7S43_016683 [Phytophthora oleae]|uniref:Uncharacterized protein n=1 Tax=Phytophthora oleae TaxID=2107226 RepID=A0ABD3EZA6_9STRA